MTETIRILALLSLGMPLTVWTPDQETRQDREILNYRNSLVQHDGADQESYSGSDGRTRANLDGADINSACAQRFLLSPKTSLPWASREVLAELSVGGAESPE
ncbi:MAG: hypothetical protein U0931_13855 [Vulcanimicrobiota bacterium]